MNILGNLLKELFITLFKNFAPSLIFAILSMCLFIQLETIDLRSLYKKWIRRFKKVKAFRWQFFFFIYFYMFLYKTLLSRSFTWKHPFTKIMEGWWIEKTEKGWNFESIDNILLFIPYTFLLFMAFYDRKAGYSNGDVIKLAAIISFFSSLFIEVVQSVLKLGTFQISDLTYNTLGGVIGIVLFLFADSVFSGRKRR